MAPFVFFAFYKSKSFDRLSFSAVFSAKALFFTATQAAAFEFLLQLYLENFCEYRRQKFRRMYYNNFHIYKNLSYSASFELVTKIRAALYVSLIKII